MSSLKEIKGRISSVKGTLKITSAMKMVASAKLHQAQNAIGNLGPYYCELMSILSKLLQHKSIDTEFTSKKDVRKVALVCFASNTSLCGSYNSNMIHESKRIVSEYRDAGLDVTVYSVGRRIADAMRREGYNSPADYSQILAKPSFAEAAKFAQELTMMYLSGEYDKIEFVYNHHKSMASQIPAKETFLPLDIACLDNEEDDGDDNIIEPTREELIMRLLPKVLNLKTYNVILDAMTAEHSSRMVAMQTATDNGNKLLQELTLDYNKSRQQKITNEILDIVSGSSA